MRRRRPNRGILLVEMMIALSLLTLVAVTITPTLFGVLRTSKAVHVLDQRAVTLRTVMSRIRHDAIAAREFVAGDSGAIVMKTSGGDPGQTSPAGAFVPGDVTYRVAGDTLTRTSAGESFDFALNGLELALSIESARGQSLLTITIRNRGSDPRGPFWDRTYRTTLRVISP